MNKTVQLVNEWAAFEETRPDASIEAFCRFYLTAQRQKNASGQLFGGVGIPPTAPSLLSKLVGYIGGVLGIYFEKAFADIPDIRQKEDFYFLSSIALKGECRKTEVVYEQLLGLTTGIDTINRLLAAGLIGERPDPDDKRAKLLHLTDKGRETLHLCRIAAQKATELVFYDLSEEDILLCIQLLQPVEARHSSLLYDLKDKNIDDIADIFAGKTSAKRASAMRKKELINAYKTQKHPIGVFQIRNTANGKVYLDASVNLEKIWNRHRFELNFGSHRNTALQQDWKTCGEAAFAFEILDEIEQKDDAPPGTDYSKELKALLKLYMETLQPYGERGYHEQAP